MPSRAKRRKREEPTPETILASFPDLLELERLKKCITECGACLLNISGEDEDNSENVLKSDDEDLQGTIGMLETCIHSFHGVCIQKWAKRDTSCPQCKARFSYIGLYSLDGRKVRLKHFNQVFFTDTLTDSENDDDESDEELTELDLGEERSSRRIRHQATRRRAREARDEEITSSRVRAAPKRSRTRRGWRTRANAVSSTQQPSTAEDKVDRAIDRAQEILRKNLRRDIEMARRRRKCQHVTEDQAKKSIEQWFTRLPYQPQIEKKIITGNYDETIATIDEPAIQQCSHIEDQSLGASSSGLSKSAIGFSRLSQTIDDQRKSKETIVSFQAALPKMSVAIPLNSTSILKGSLSTSSFDMFCHSQPKYADDFLLISSRNENVPKEEESKKEQ